MLSPHLIILSAALTLFSPTLAEKKWLQSFGTFPEAHTLVAKGSFVVDSTSKTEISMIGPVTLSSSPPDSGLHIALVPADYLRDKLQNATFCCDRVDSNKCGKVGDFAPSLGGEDIFSIPVNQESLRSGFGTKIFRPKHTGMHIVTLVNCDAKTAETVSFQSGEIQAVGQTGYLPADEHPKLFFYQGLLWGYVAMLATWCVWCSSWREVLFRIHGYIGLAALVGLMEAGCWYASLYHWNYIGHRWWSMIFLASIGTVVKQATCLTVLLMTALGSGFTKPGLDTKTLSRIGVLYLGFVIFECWRLIETLSLDRVHSAYSMYRVVMIVAPGSLMFSIFLSWICSALSDTFQFLEEKKQTAKQEVFRKLRILIVALFSLGAVIVVYDTYLVMYKGHTAQFLMSRYLFADVCSHVAFFVILGFIMILLRPNERSVQMAYSEQLAGGENEVAAQPTDDFETVELEEVKKGGM